MTARRPLTAAVLLPALLLPAPLLTGCAQSVDPIERLGMKAAQRVEPAARTVTASEETLPPYRRWGLPAPLRRPPKPSAAPPARTVGPGLPPVLDRIRTRDRVVFLTYDYAPSGTRRDSRFAGLVRDLRLPVTLFVTASATAPSAATAPARTEFARLRAAGAAVQNRTSGRGSLRGLPYAVQRARICGQQDGLRARFDIHARFLRPPRGTYDTTTLHAAADCGVGALILWRASMATGTLTYAHGDRRLCPGDIVRLGPERPTGPSLSTRTTRLLRTMQQNGLTAARLEDYL
ncbi:polysaccharide deacetylase family protein [Streptomyces sp. NPDC047000]|uniref:polysaccharide deacetylase family protein n=1 Tax=Streptomyces sp. NPDC047000 TaxID=3155474 RepID=UPI0034018300